MCLAEDRFMVLRFTIILGLLGLLASTGCGKKGLGIYPVSGVVKVDGNPTPGVMVIFCPVDAADAVKKLRPYAFTDAEGKFQLTTNEKGDGAPAGHYKVLLQWVSNSPPTPTGEITMGDDRLHGRYMNLEKTQFAADLKEETNNLAPFELKSK